jgi:3-oxoacyl-[acyl-carrier protein] reductase
MTKTTADNRRVAVVTGSSSGIGRAIAIRLAIEGMHVVLHGRSPSDHLDEVEQTILADGNEFNRDVRVGKVYGDFSQAIDWQNFVDDAWRVFGSVDCWINNAGGDVLTGDKSSQSIEEKLGFLWQTDVVSSLMLSRIAGRHMLKQNSESRALGACSIVNIGWDQAANGMDGDSGELFATTKGAIMAMTKSLAQTLAPIVRVNCVAPGWIQTSWGEQTSEYWDRRAKQESLMDRWGTPDDVANAVSFLCRSESNFLSGQVLPVNGGFRYGCR